MTPAPEIAVAVDARLAEKGAATLLEIDLSRAVEATAFVLADPDRLVVDLPEVAFRIDESRHAAPGKGLVRAYRYGQFLPGRSRIVVDLARPAKVTRVVAAALSPEGDGPARLTIELAPDEREAFRAAARKNAAVQREAARAAAAARPEPVTADAPIVVIDPGHGGIDPGAVSRVDGVETREKDVVLDFARELAALLRADGRFKVVMTRSTDAFVPLDQRVGVARAAGAALFVSIHADSLRGGQGVSGATVYTVSDRASDAEAARIADNENAADGVAGVETAESAGDVADILFDLTRRETRAFANVFSRDLVTRMATATTMHKIPSRSAGFRVLKAPDVPSVLIELGYMSSQHDVKAMTSPDWRKRSTSAVAEAISTFMAAAAAAPPSRAEARPRGALAAAP